MTKNRLKPYKTALAVTCHLLLHFLCWYFASHFRSLATRKREKRWDVYLVDAAAATAADDDDAICSPDFNKNTPQSRRPIYLLS